MDASPRIFGIVATHADVAAVIRRGPTEWFHIGRWDLSSHVFSSGSWFHGALYPQKCDLSPDGRWLLYSAMKTGADWPAGEIYEAVSVLPWLHALAAWESGTTYTRGYHFTEERVNRVGDPDVGTAGPLLTRYGLTVTRPVQFAVERRRGWVEDPLRSGSDGGPWDENRVVTMQKTQPGGVATLSVTGTYAAFRSSPEVRSESHYALELDGTSRALHDLQWADWSHDGSLIGATRSGALGVWSTEAPMDPELIVADLARLSPDPQPPPPSSRTW